MEKIIDFFKRNFQNLLKQYPITMIVVFLGTFFLSFFSERDFLDFDLFMKIFLFFLFYFLGTLFTEIVIDKKKRIYSYILYFIISIALVYLISRVNSLYVTKIIICYVTILIVILFYKLYLNSKLSLGKYLIGVFNNLLKTWAIYLVLLFGLSLVSLIFITLIYDDFNIVARIQIFAFGIYLIPNIILNISNIKSDDFDVGKIIIHYILESLIIVSFAIIYIYILKILITWTIPSNVVFRILGILFIIALPIWIMNKEYKDDYLGKINDYLPGLFIPFVFMEIFSLYLRIMSSGITILRYLGILLILFQIIFIYLYYFKKEKIYYIFHILIILVIVSTFVPIINMFSASYYSQIKVLKTNYLLEPKTKLSINRLSGAYNYLNTSLDGDKYLNKYFDKETLNKIKIIIKENNNIKNNSIYFNIKLKEIDISSYDKMTLFYDSSYEKGDSIFINYQDKKIDITKEIERYCIDLSAFEKDDFFKHNNEIFIDNLKIIFNLIDVEYIGDEKTTINYYSIGGIILEKNNV